MEKPEAAVVATVVMVEPVMLAVAAVAATAVMAVTVLAVEPEAEAATVVMVVMEVLMEPVVAEDMALRGLAVMVLLQKAFPEVQVESQLEEEVLPLDLLELVDQEFVLSPTWHKGGQHSI